MSKSKYWFYKMDRKVTSIKLYFRNKINKILAWIIKKLYSWNLRNEFDYITVFETDDWICWGWVKYIYIDRVPHPITDCKYITKK